LIRVCPATFVIGHKAYVVTGTDSNFNSLTECWEYDANSDKWTQKANFTGTARAYDIGFAIGNKGFIGMGYDVHTMTYFKDIWEYDTTADAWKRKNDFGGSVREEASAFAVGNNGYLCFGEDNVIGWTRDMWQYDTILDMWTQKSSYPSGVGLYGVAGFVIGNNIYVGTGQDSSSKCYQFFWRYNTLTDTWNQEAKFPGAPRGDCSAFAVGDSGYMGFGTDNNAILYSDFHKFYPDTLSALNELPGNEMRITIYPNPFVSSCCITINDDNGINPVFTLYDIQGRKVNTQITHSGNIYKIDRGDLSEGVYLLTIQINDQTINKKLIITNN
jgi:hypothetical protein